MSEQIQMLGRFEIGFALERQKPVFATILDTTLSEVNVIHLVALRGWFVRLREFRDIFNSEVIARNLGCIIGRWIEMVIHSFI
jgi:hypothetical protein